MIAKRILHALVLATVASLMVGCAAPKPTVFKAVKLTPKVKAGLLEQKADNFLIILDASSSMAQLHKRQYKLNIANYFVSQLNHSIPDLFIMAGLRKFGPRLWSTKEKSELLYGMTQWSREGLEKALKPIKWAGHSPLAEAIDAGTEDLKPLGGNSAVIIVTDGPEAGNAPAAAQRMKAAYGDTVCIYPVLVGSDPQDKKIISEIAAARECGFAVTVEEVSGSVNMASYVERVFVKEGMPPVPAPKVAVPAKPAPKDSDGDGVVDTMDKCPDTPGGVEVGGDGCPFDTDMDGVPDYLDKCPKTPVSAPVNEVGCWVIRPVEFDTNKWDIKPRFHSGLDQVVEVLKKNPWLEVIIEGHTDNRGTAKYNQKLSERRAKTVMKYLVEKGLNRGKATPVGYGFSKPTATNDTAEEMARNRRAEIRFRR